MTIQPPIDNDEDYIHQLEQQRDQFIELAQRIGECRRSKTQLSLKEYCKVLDELVALGQSFEEGKT